MGVRENKVETHLKNEVKRVLNGECRKWVSPGCAGVPDQIVIIPGQPVMFIEVKTSDGRLSPAQIREHKRLREVGAEVHTVFGQNGVNSFISYMKEKW